MGMANIRLRVAARIACAITALAIFPSHSVAADWPLFYGRVGAYSVRTPGEIADMARSGFDFALMVYARPDSPMGKAAAEHGIRYIDNWPQGIITAACRGSGAAAPQCYRRKTSEILGRIKQHLEDTADDPNIIGYWILDDYPGADVRELLRQTHDLLEQVNRHSTVKRPAICGFGGSAPMRPNPAAQLTVNNHAFDQAVSNFDPRACDLVVLYPYGVDKANDRSDVDWSLGPVLPHMLASLRDRGWDPEKQPLIGMPQTFGYPYPGVRGRFYPTPTASDVETQVVAYCRAGATAILAYTWNDSYPGPKHALYNTPALIRGLQKGVSICKNNYWNNR
jgi:hypothetical protein